MAAEKHARQSFLGPNAQSHIETAKLGLVGLGGGGSHLVQQFAHIGFRNYVLCDPDVVEWSNLNRLVGATLKDVEEKRPKIEVAQRVIAALEESANVLAIQDIWQNAADALKSCTLILGCLDGLSVRSQLEAHARRFLIPYIDIGMDVHPVPGNPPSMTGQVIASIPGHPCLRCMQFLTVENLGREEAGYGAAGSRPQVVWPNGILASSAVGIAVDLVTNWTNSSRGPVYLSYDGNKGTLEPHVRLRYLPQSCIHYPMTQSGPVAFEKM